MSNFFKNILIVIAPPPSTRGKPSQFMINRIRKAIQLSKKNNYSRIIFSGGKTKNHPPSADIMKVMSMTYLDQKKVLVDRNSRDLLHNALFCWELIKENKPKKITILTNHFEQDRAKFLFQKTYKHLGVSLHFESCRDNVDIIQGTYLKIKEFVLLTKLKLGGIK